MKPLIIGNWKMNGSLATNLSLLSALVEQCDTTVADWVICPPFPYLAQCQQLLDQSSIACGAQTVSAHHQGAHTGQVSAAMLQEFGVSYVLAGHSERRHELHESDEQVAGIAAMGLAAGMQVVVCVGETIEQRDANELVNVLKQQLQPVLAMIKEHEAAQLIIAYEPVWAIGTGRTADPADIMSALSEIRYLLQEKGANFSNSVKILYGGSVKPANAASLLELELVDGLLVGGASLDAIAFCEIGSC